MSSPEVYPCDPNHVCVVSGEDTPKLGLAMTGPMSGTADPYWQRLSDLVVQGSVASQHAEELKEVFTLEANLHKWQGRVPSYLLSGVSHPLLSPHSFFLLFFSVLFFAFFLGLPCSSLSLYCCLPLHPLGLRPLLLDLLAP